MVYNMEQFMHQDQAISSEGKTVAFRPDYVTESRTAEPVYGSALTFKTRTHTLGADGFAISQI